MDNQKMIVASVAGVAVLGAVLWYIGKKKAEADNPLNPSVLKYNWPKLSASSSPDSVIGAWKNGLQAILP